MKTPKLFLLIISVAFLTTNICAQNVGIGVSSPLEKLDINGNLNLTGTIKVNGTAGTSGEVLASTGTGLQWAKGVYTINSANYLSISIPEANYVRIDGTLALTNDYLGFNNNFLSINGGVINGSGQSISFGNNCILNGVSFNNVVTSGNNIQFVNCKFTNVSQLPFRCSLISCQITGSNISSTIGNINNSTINNSSVTKIEKIINSNIGGNSTINVYNASNNQFVESVINLAGTFTGNDCDDSQINIQNTVTTNAVTGNNFKISTLFGVISVDLSTSNAIAVNISNNTFVGTSTYPTTRYLRITGSYTGTRCIIKVSNNIAIGGTATGGFVYPQYTGNADLTVNDNDLYAVGGGLGVSNGGLIYVRNNQTH